MRFSDLVGVAEPPDQSTVASRTAVDTDSYLNRLSDEPRNNGFVTALVDRRRGKRMTASRRGFLRATIATAAATTAVSAAGLFGPARKVEAQSGVVGTYPRRILQYCPPYNSGDNCQPGCGSSPICTDCCDADGYFRNDPANGYTLYAGGCGDGDIADGWLWRYSGKCGNCAEIEYRCSDGYVQTDTGPAPFICRAVTDCVPLPEGEEPGELLPDAARSTNWRPAGALEVAIDQGTAVSITGWISDGSGVPVQMRIRADNSIVHFGTAALPRPDIPSSRRGSAVAVGFAVSFPIAPGDYEFCVDALSGVNNANIGCVRLDVGSGASVRGSGVTGSITPPVTTAPPSNSDSDNDSTTATPTPQPTPGEIVLPEETADTASAATYGAVQVIRRSGETTGFVSGWAGAPDAVDAAFVEVLVDGESAVTIQTDLPRPDVEQAFDILNGATGFAVSFPLPANDVEVCVVAVHPDDGKRQPLGCQQLGAITEDPPEEQPGRPTASGSSTESPAIVYGGIDTVEVGDARVLVSGWAFDPNERDRTITVSAQASGVTTTGSTGLENTTAQRVYGTDVLCGFELAIDLSPGTHELSVTAQTSDGTSTVIGQQTVVIP